MLHIITHTLEHSIKILPFLFITYLIMEYLEHKTSEKTKNTIKKSGRFGPIIGGLLGAVPQCGFSVSATNLYAGRVITLGTLVAIYLSTSDEMLPILISKGTDLGLVLKILAIKILIGMIVGIILDFIFKVKDESTENIHELCEHEHCHCEESILKSSIKHTLQIFFFIFIISFALNLVLHTVGEDVLAGLILNRPILGPIIAGIVGLIPNCASSVIITQIYSLGQLSLGGAVAGLSVNAGLGLAVLFKQNKNIKENIFVLLFLYFVSVMAGTIIVLVT